MSLRQQRSDLPILHGRDPERARLVDLIDDTADGQGSLVLLSGEAGIGKTALSTAVAVEAADRGMLVLTGGCYDLATTPPYGPWVEITRAYRMVDGLPPLPDALSEGGEDLGAIDSQPALFDLVARFLADVAGQQPLLLILEDIHWADQASLDLLRYLSRTLREHAVLLLATYRDDELSRDHPLSLLIPPLVREGSVHRFPLQRLGNDAVRELVRDRYRLIPDDETRLASYIIEMAQGNPFFINELLLSLGEDDLLSPMAGRWRVGDLSRAGVPTLVQQFIERRLARLDCTTRDLLDVMAVVGFDVSLDLLRDVHGSTPSELDRIVGEVIDHRLLELKSDLRTLRFIHALVRQTIYEQIPPFRRQQLHLELGDIVAERSLRDPSNVANHLYRAGDERAIEWLIRAAEQAQAVYAPEIVLLQCGRAIELAGQHGQEAPIAVYRLRGIAREMVGDFDGALDDLEMALRLAREQGNQRAEWQGLLDLGTLWASRDHDRMGDYCQQAVDLARVIGDAEALGHSLNRLGNWHVNVERPREGLLHHEEALQIFEELDDRSGAASTLDLIALSHALAGNMGEAHRGFERAIRALRLVGDRKTLASALATVNDATGFQYHGNVTRIYDLLQAIGSDPGELLAEAVDIAQDIGSRSGEAFALAYSGRWLAVSGKYQEAIDTGKHAAEIAEQIQHSYWITLTRALLSLTYIEVLAWDSAATIFERILQVGRSMNSLALIRVISGALASYCVLIGDHSRAQRLLDSVVDLETPPDTLYLRQPWYAYAELALARKRYDDALDILDTLIGSIPGSGGILSPKLVRRRGEALLGLGRLDEAEAELDRALDGALQFGYPTFIWPAWASLRRLYLEQGRVDAAEDARRKALEVVHRMASSLEEDELRQNFLEQARPRLPETLPFTARRSYGGLTEREMEVLRLVNEGLTDAQIAEQLYISPRTASAHVTNVLGKLNAANRTMASRIAVERGLID